MLKTTLMITLSILMFFSAVFTVPKVVYNSTTTPLGPPKYKKLVYFVIDGLRFDGFVPSHKSDIYYNNFTFTKDPEIISRTFFSVSAIPTATTCRIIGLMTGAPSNTIEEIFTFFMKKVRIESLPDKLADRRLFVYGDNLWPLCFKAFGNNAVSCCGFGKTDVVKTEVEMVKKALENRDVDAKFIHTITVDSFGHTCGTINAEELRDAQLRADDLLTKIYRDMDDDTLLVVTSDHGVTNEGAHGGSSKYEMASFCGFYAKKPIELTDFPDSIYNVPFLEKFYDCTDFNTGNDWIKAKTPYRVIHQDDILPTVCYLMGVSAPANTYGSLIPYLVDDESAQKTLLDQKITLLSRFQKISTENKSSSEMNYKVTELIYAVLMKKSRLLALASFGLGLAAVLRLLFKSFKSHRLLGYVKSMSPFIITTVMVTHSYWSFASEDIAWAFTFLLTNFSLANLVFILFFTKVPGRKMFAEDRLNLRIPQFSSDVEIWLWVFLFFIVKNIKFYKKYPTWSLNHRFVSNCIRSLPQLCYILISQIRTMSYASKVAFISAYPSLDSLVAVHLSPPIALLMLYFLRNINYKKSQVNKNLLLAFCPYLVNFEKVQQSINYEVFFTLTSDFNVTACAIGAFSYLIVPRLYIIRNFKTNEEGYTLSTFSLIFCFICSWVMDGTLVFQYFFIGRLLFVTLFFITDALIDAFTEGTRSRNQPVGELVL